MINVYDIFSVRGCYANPDYKEILKLDAMLTEANIPHVLERMFDGWRICYPEDYDSGNIVMDAIQHHGSYGNSHDRIEIMGLLTPEEEECDSVAGWLTADDVFGRIQKHYLSIKEEVSK